MQSVRWWLSAHARAAPMAGGLFAKCVNRSSRNPAAEIVIFPAMGEMVFGRPH